MGDELNIQAFSRVYSDHFLCAKAQYPLLPSCLCVESSGPRVFLSHYGHSPALHLWALDQIKCPGLAAVIPSQLLTKVAWSGVNCCCISLWVS